jgi:hypothetical protein
MRLLSSFGLLLVLYQTLAASAEEHSATPSDGFTPIIGTVYAHDALGAAEDPLQMGSMSPMDTCDSPRHRQEKAHLMKRMGRKNGKWTLSHPRYRLLEALYGYRIYCDQNLAELNRWRSLYKNVGKKQKKVMRRTVALFHLLTTLDSGEGG